MKYKQIVKSTTEGEELVVSQSSVWVKCQWSVNDQVPPSPNQEKGKK